MFTNMLTKRGEESWRCHNSDEPDIFVSSEVWHRQSYSLRFVNMFANVFESMFVTMTVNVFVIMSPYVLSLDESRLY